MMLGGVGLLELAHLLPPPNALSGLGHLHRIVLVAYLVFLFWAEVRKQLG